MTVVLHGRDVERAHLAEVLDQARQSHAGAVVVHGDAGVGKSALLDDLVASASGARVLRAQGLESESPLPFAALHRLLRPVADLLDRLPGPQARALRVAFGEQDGVPVEPFLVAVGTLSMLTEAAEKEAVLCVVDDAQWLDAASADALLFVARRIQADRVALVFAARDGDVLTFDPPGLPSLRLSALDETAARAVLADRVGDEMSAEVAARILQQASGNPLALVELPTVLTPEQLHGETPLPSRLPLTARVERVFLDRCRRLSTEAQTLVLLAAADNSGQVSTLRRAATAFGIKANALREAEVSGLLLTEGDSFHVRHPLVRSAIYQSATSIDRREVHRALAEALEGAGAADRATWHLAAAADGPDEQVAEALERAASSAEQRGGYVEAAAAYERCADLTENEEMRAARLLASARNAWACGQSTRTRELATNARQLAHGNLLRADIDRLRGRIEFNVGSASDAHRIYAQAARDVAADDVDRALDLAMAATVLRVYGADSGTSLEAAAIFVDAAPDDTPRRRSLKYLLTTARHAASHDWASAVESLRPALQAGAEVSDPDVLVNLGNVALDLGDDEGHRRSFTAVLSAARERGAGMTVLYAQPRLAFTEFAAGHWTALRTSAAEALALSASLGQRPLTAGPLAWLTVMAALLGTPDYDALLSQLEDVTETQSLGILTVPVQDLTHFAKATRASNAGDADAAHHHLRQLRVAAIIRMVAIDRIDAAVRAGDSTQAAAWLEHIATFAEATRWEWALASTDHGRALLASAEDAPHLFESSLAHHAAAGRPYAAARTHLAYGEFLRRSQRRVDARTHLKAALAGFSDLRAEALVARATQELRASGETARKRDPSTLVKLTAMELQVAQLVSQGLSNKEVAAQLWVSPRTIAFHLRNCFTKTGVKSRGELSQLQLA